MQQRFATGYHMMPYTPPSARSPVASATTSPITSRRSSLGGANAYPPSSSPRPELPRSSSYLTRQHRRSPAVKSTLVTQAEEPTPPGTADSEASDLHVNINGSIRKSPPPITDESRPIPNTAVLSPPESTNNSSDDDVEERGQQDKNLEELKAAIRLLEQTRSSSPVKQAKDLAKANEVLSMLSMGSDEDEPLSPELKTIQRHLSVSARKLMHQRSNTDSSVFMGLGTQSNSEEEDSDDDERYRGSRKPPMLRKKSGELVRPALRPSSAKRRPSSMPGTPTYSKAVHFDNNLEHVRHFLQVDRPLAVSAGSSPVETYEEDSEFPFQEEEKQPSYEWEIIVASFANEAQRHWQPVRLERVFLSADNKNLVGTVAVANMGYQKTIIARFTLDYWKTTSEVVAEYLQDVRREREDDGFDRFSFSVKLADQANLEAKTMFFCIKYCVNGQEHWDNNCGTNYQVDFRKKMRSPVKKGRPNHSLPRSNRKAVQKPRQLVPIAFDDFSQTFDSKFDLNRTLDDIDTENPTIRLKGVKSAFGISDSINKKKPASGNAFSTRYDFSTSLASAMNAANTLLGESSGLPQPPKDQRPNAPAPGITPSVSAVADAMKRPGLQTNQSAKGTDSPVPVGAEKPSLASTSYSELLDKYCFFGSARGSPVTKDGSLGSRNIQMDGNEDGSSSGIHTPSPVHGGSPAESPYQESPLRLDTTRGRSRSPAPMTSFATGTSTMYPYTTRRGYPLQETHSVTAIRG